MKIMKIKLGLLSLLAVLAVSILITSCEQDVITEQIDTTLNQEITDGKYTGVTYKLPKGYDEWAELEINNYMSKLTEVEFDQLIENHRIAAFLESKNLWESVDAKLTYGEILSKERVSEFLTDRQAQELNDYISDNEIDMRACGSCAFAYQQCTANGCWGVNGVKYPHRNVYKRTCSGGNYTYTYVCKTTCSY